MRIANYGCGYDIRDEDQGWINFDVRHNGSTMRVWDMTQTPDSVWVEHFDAGVINHVLCTMNDDLAHRVLINIHRTLKPGGKLTIIDMDLLKVFNAYKEGRIEDIPIELGTLDDKLCLAISGYGTRDSLYTPRRMAKVLEEAGFRTVKQLDSSEYDTRPKESLVFEAIK